MSISALSTGNYKASTIVNNPPYITNYPFYEYMKDKKLDFKNTDLSISKEMVKKLDDNDNYMTGLYAATVGGVCVAGYVARNKLKHCWRRVSDGVRRAFRA